METELRERIGLETLERDTNIPRMTFIPLQVYIYLNTTTIGLLRQTDLDSEALSYSSLEYS